jgi:hypothetical protein
MEEPKRMDRREALKWMLAATASLSVLRARGLGAASLPAAAGYGHDPKLLEVYKPGDLWPLTFSPEQRQTAVALCDIILPTDEKSPSAGELRVPDFIDEWISAPYPMQRADRKLLLAGLDWLDAESAKRFRKSFVDATAAQRSEICDDICYEPKAWPVFRKAARFFARFRDLTMSGFYTTPEGMKDIQYIGNVPLPRFDRPPPEVLAYLKLA